MNLYIVQKLDGPLENNKIAISPTGPLPQKQVSSFSFKAYFVLSYNLKKSNHKSNLSGGLLSERTNHSSMEKRANIF